MSEEMKDIGSLLGGIIANARANQVHNDEDYVNPDDGLLYCGKCNTPKQYKLEMPMGLSKGSDGEKVIHKVPVLCECERKKADEEKKRQQEIKDMQFISQLRSKSLMDEKFSDQTFGTFKTTKDNARALKICRRYADGFDEMVTRNQGLLFWGDVGTGKTFAAACIANALLNKRVPVVMTSFVKLLEGVQGFKEDEDKLLSKLNRAKLLIIDDLGAERSTDFALEKVYNIIDSRYRAKLPMILTTNLDLEEMKRVTDIRYSRIYDRIFEVCYPVKFTGPSFRKVEANKRFKEMRDFLEG